MSAAVVARDRRSGSTTTTTTTTSKAETTQGFCNGMQSRHQLEVPASERPSQEGGGGETKQRSLDQNNPSKSLSYLAAATNQTSTALSPQMRSPSDNPLPPELKKILEEVAQSGMCSRLPWNSPQGVASLPAPHGSRLPPSQHATHQHALKRSHQYQHHYPLNRHHYATAPPRKKPRNGVPRSNRSTFTDGARKRPLVVIRTSNSSAVFSPPGSSVGSGRTSGSEQEDITSQYECDSEGTSATSNSEFSGDRSYRKMPGQELNKGSESSTQTYSCLREVFRTAISLLLEHYFQLRGGYTLSPAEKRRYTMSKGSLENEGKSEGLAQNGVSAAEATRIDAEEVFRQRWKRLLSALDPPSVPMQQDAGPPFTIQRIAEVLIAPERYYTQTHKLCNCLEKLLLVTSSTSAFGGSTGGATSQSRREEREMAALHDEKGRLQSQLRQKRLRRRTSSSVSDEIVDGMDVSHLSGMHTVDDRKCSPDRHSAHDSEAGKSVGDHSMDTSSTNAASREFLEAAARASLRSKFDHVGIDPHHAGAANNRDVRAIAESRGMTNSPPPPSLSMSAAVTGMHGGLLRQHSDHDHHGLSRSPSPILFGSGNEASSPPSMHSNPNIHLLHVNHAAAVAGLSPLELMAYRSASPSQDHLAATASAITSMAKELDLESRSSASSDVDSESDDVSFDDSASDRSDGSDSGGQHYEPFSAARAMALNRMQQQQQRLQQSRLITSLHLSSAPTADAEYQSGDSIDSARADDSGGSDSSSSDLAD